MIDINNKKILINSIIYVVGPQLPRILGLFLMPILTPYLSTTDYAMWGLTVAIVYLFNAGRDAGMSVLLVNSFFKYPKRWKFIWRYLFGYLILWGLLLGILQSLIIWMVFRNTTPSWVVSIIILYFIQFVVFDLIVFLGIRYYQLEEKPYSVSIISIIGGLVGLFVLFYSVIIVNIGFMGWILSSFVSSGLMCLMYSFLVIKRNKLFPIFSFKKNRLSRVARTSFPMLPHSYSPYLLNTSDRFMLSAYQVPVRDIGIYNVAYSFGNYLEGLGSAIGVAVGPAYMKLFAKAEAGEAEVKKITHILQLIFVTGTFLLAVWARELFGLLFRNKDFNKAYILGIVIIMGYSYRPLYWAVIGKIQFEERTQLMWKISFLAGIVNVILNAIFIPFWGIYSATLMTLIALLFQGFSGYFFFRAATFVSKMSLLVWFIVIILLTVIAYLCRDQDILMKLYITLISIAISIFFYYEMKKKL